MQVHLVKLDNRNTRVQNSLQTLLNPFLCYKLSRIRPYICLSHATGSQIFAHFALAPGNIKLRNLGLNFWCVLTSPSSKFQFSFVQTELSSAGSRLMTKGANIQVQKIWTLHFESDIQVQTRCPSKGWIMMSTAEGGNLKLCMHGQHFPYGMYPLSATHRVHGGKVIQ